jgi:hypothetical protein
MLYFTYTQTMSATDLGTLTNNMKNDWVTHMAGQTTANISLLEVFANDLSSVTAPEAVDSLPSRPGTIVPATSPSLPYATCFVVGNETNRKYRGGHSRNYLPGMPQSGMVDGNTWSVAFQSAIITAWQAFLQEFVTTLVPTAVGVLTQTVAHRFGRPAGAPPDSELPSVPLANPFTDTVVAYHSDPQVGSQRRRNHQGG